MLTRKTASRTALLSLALILLAAVGVVLACAPAAPPAQDSPPPVAAEPTATPTPTPTPEPGITPNLAYVAHAVYRLAEQQNRGAAGAGGASGGPQLPERIYVYVTAWTSEVDDLEQLLRDNGATNISVSKDVEVSTVESQMPPTLLPDITRHQSFVHAFTEGIYPNMDQALNDWLTKYAGNLLSASEVAGDLMRGAWMPDYPEHVRLIIEPEEGYRDSIRHFLTSNGSFLRDSEPGLAWFYATVPVPVIAELSVQPGVGYIKAWIPPISLAEPQSEVWTEQPGPTEQAVPATREGASVHGALAWQTGNTPNTGQGIKVGVIDAGFKGFISSRMGNHLPNATSVHYRCITMNPVTMTETVVTGTGVPPAFCGNNDTHGTMVSEAIYDVAPGAVFYISNDLLSDASGWMIDNGVKIISYSGGTHWDGPGNGISQKTDSSLNVVKKAVSRGALWVNAAGNNAESSWFKRGAQVSRTTRGNFLRFDGTDDCNDIPLQAGATYLFQLRWDGVWGGSNDDLSVQIWRSERRASPDGTSVITLTREARSNNVQLRSTTADTDPYDQLIYTVPPNVSNGHYCLRVQVQNGSMPSWVQVELANGSAIFQHKSKVGQSIIQPADSIEAGMLAVGAAAWDTPDAIQTYSSVGPTLDGRIKPDLVGSDNVPVDVFAGASVSGTSQAAPHIAGLAALLLKRHSFHTPKSLAYFLKVSAMQRVTAMDPNNTWGHGFAWLPDPTARLGKPTGLTSANRSMGVTLSWNDTIDATGYLVQQWDGRASPPQFRTLPFTETDGSYSRTYAYELTGAGAEIGNLVNGVSYTYRVTSLNGASSSPWSSWVVGTAVSSLTTPANLRGTSRHRGVALDWNDVAGATAYRVQQWDGRAGGWRTLPFRESHVNYDYSITFSGSSARIGNLTNGVSYAHRVQAYKTDDESGWSGWIGTTARGLAGDSDGGVGGAADPGLGNPTPAPPPNPGASDGSSDGVSGQNAPPAEQQQGSPTPTPPAPQNEPSDLTAMLVDDAVVLHWMPGSNPHYVQQVVKRREAGVRPEVWTDFEVDVSAHSYTDSTAASGKTYIYRVKGLRENGRGGTSGRAAVTVP